MNREKTLQRKKRFRTSIKDKAYVKLGRKCNNPACQWLNPDGSRGCTDFRCLQVDHVDDDGSTERASGAYTEKIYRLVLNDVEGRYQLLCANCNWIKKFKALQSVLLSAGQ
jgi:hypothetical protein